jgi:hypothetical protein
MNRERTLKIVLVLVGLLFYGGSCSADNGFSRESPRCPC